MERLPSTDSRGGASGLAIHHIFPKAIAAGTWRCSKGAMKKPIARSETQWRAPGGPGPSDFADADLGDRRRTERLRDVADAISRGRDKSFPQMFPSSADLEGTYRFLANPHVDPRAILAAHANKTAERVVRASVALLISDTTEMCYDGIGRAGLTTLANRQSFFAHCALAITADGSRRPLGVLAARTYVRKQQRKWTRSEQKTLEYLLRDDKESRRWCDVAEEAEALVPKLSLVHVMDREADSYEIFWRLIQLGRRFVIRTGSRERRVRAWLKGPVHTLQRALSRARYFLSVDVPLSRRKGSPFPDTARLHPPRDARRAKLEYCALPLLLEKPKRSPHLRDAPDKLQLNLVYVREVDTPKGCDPIEWILATTEPVETAEQVTQIVDWYRARWTVEEFFKALKTGCGIENRQLETYDGLCRALMVTMPTACQLLDLRSLAHAEPRRPALHVVTEAQLEVLRLWSPRVLPKRPTVRDALFAIAALGGHIRNNGAPGWITLARGLTRLDDGVDIRSRERGSRSGSGEM